MKQTIGSLVLTILAFFSTASLTAQVHLSAGGAEELADQLRQQGWHDAAPGVLQRQLPNQIQKITIGKEGLEHAIQELRQRVAAASNAYRKNPYPERKQALGSLRNRLTRMEKTIAALESEPSAAALPPGCSYFVSCSAAAYPLFPTHNTNGVGAEATAYAQDVHNNCGVTATVYAYTEGWTDEYQDYAVDVDAALSPTKPEAVAAAVTFLPGGPVCGSHAYASIDITGVYMTCERVNEKCTPP